VKRLILATAVIALAASFGDASAYDVPRRTRPLTWRRPDQNQEDFTAICRRAGDSATPRPQSARIVGHVLIIDGGDHRRVDIDHKTGDVTLHCVNAWFHARWERETP
jgi:hypothetical protein